MTWLSWDSVATARPCDVAAPQVTPQVTPPCCGTRLGKLLALGGERNDVEQGDSLVPSSEGFFFLFGHDPPFPAVQLLLQTHMESVSVGDCSGLQLHSLNFAQKLQRGDCVSLKETAFPPVPATGWEQSWILIWPLPLSLGCCSEPNL